MNFSLLKQPCLVAACSVTTISSQPEGALSSRIYDVTVSPARRRADTSGLAAERTTHEVAKLLTSVLKSYPSYRAPNPLFYVQFFRGGARTRGVSCNLWRESTEGSLALAHACGVTGSNTDVFEKTTMVEGTEASKTRISRQPSRKSARKFLETGETQVGDMERGKKDCQALLLDNPNPLRLVYDDGWRT